MSDENKVPITLTQLRRRVHIVTGILIAVVLVWIAKELYQAYNPTKIESAPKISLNEIIVAYSPSNLDANIIFLDKATNQVKLILSEDVTRAIFVLKSSGMTDDYLASLKNKKPK